MRLKPDGPIALNRSNGITRGLVGAWPLNEHGALIARDYSGFRAHGVNNGAPSVIRPAGRAVSFATAGQWISVPDRPWLKPTAAITICAWFPFLSAGSDGAICGKVTTAFSYSIHVNGGNQSFDFQYNVAGSTIVLNDRPSAAGGLDKYKNTDVFMCAVYDGAQARIYINGILSPNANAASGSLAVSTDPFGIGARGGDGSNQCNFPIYQILLFNRAVTSQEIKSLNASPSQLYQSGPRKGRAPAVAAPPSPNSAKCWPWVSL